MKKEHIKIGNLINEQKSSEVISKSLEVDRVRKCPKCHIEFNLGDALRKHNEFSDWFLCSKCGYRLLSPKSSKRYLFLSQQKIDVKNMAEKYKEGKNEDDIGCTE